MFIFSIENLVPIRLTKPFTWVTLYFTHTRRAICIFGLGRVWLLGASIKEDITPANRHSLERWTCWSPFTVSSYLGVRCKPITENWNISECHRVVFKKDYLPKKNNSKLIWIPIPSNHVIIRWRPQPQTKILSESISHHIALENLNHKSLLCMPEFLPEASHYWRHVCHGPPPTPLVRTLGKILETKIRSIAGGLPEGGATLV